MQTFSEENLEHLQHELELVSKTIGSLREDLNYYNRLYGFDPTNLAIQNALAEKITLEAKIAVISSFLHG